MKMPFYTFSKRSFGLRATYLHEQGYNRALAAKELSILYKEQPQNNIVTEYKAKIENELGLAKNF